MMTLTLLVVTAIVLKWIGGMVLEAVKIVEA